MFFTKPVDKEPRNWAPDKPESDVPCTINLFANVMFADPLNELPARVRDVVRVAALPVVFWFHVGTDPVRPVYGNAVAVIDPEPDATKLQPVPQTIAAVVLVLPVKAENAVAPVLLNVQVVETHVTPPPVNVNDPVVELMLATPPPPPPTADKIPLVMVTVVPSGLTAPKVDVVATGRSPGTIWRIPTGPREPSGVATKELAVNPRVALIVRVPFAVNGDPITVSHDGVASPILVIPLVGGVAHPVASPLASIPFGN